LRVEKKLLIAGRDAALSVAGRLKSGEQSHDAAQVVFFAGMAARGISRARALRLWRAKP